MIKKIVLIILAVLTLAGCSINKEDQQSPITISILFNNKESTPFKSDWRILEEYQKRKNVILNIYLGDDADFEKSISQYVNSENPPDVILKCWPDTIVEYANSGMILPISDYESLMPYFKAYIQNNGLQDEIDKLRLNNGKYYILPGFRREIQAQQWIYRKDLFENNNLKQPETYDELFESLIILKEKYPDSTPITASWGGAHLFAMMGAGYGIPAGWAGERYYNYENDKWLFAPSTNNYKEMYKFLNKCYEAGILDPDIFKQSDEEFIDKIENGKALVTVTWITSGLDIWDYKLQENGIADGNWEPLPVMKSTIGIKALPPVDIFKKGLVVMADVADKPYFVELIEFLDWAIYSEEGNDLTTWGVEGLTYENTAEGKRLLPDIITPKNTQGVINMYSEYGFDLIFDLIENEEFEDYKKPYDIVEFLNRSEEAGETLEQQPNLELSFQDTEIIESINEKLLEYVNETSLMFITGEMDIESDWAEYIRNLDLMGYRTLEKIWDEAWDYQKNDK